MAVTPLHEEKEVEPVPCVRYPGYSAAQFVHPEGICACFHGGPAPIAAPTPPPVAEGSVPLQRKPS
jgi:hypothetical protein